MGRLIDKNEVAKRLDCSKRSVDALVRTGKLPAINLNASGKINTRFKFDERDVLNLINDSRVTMKAEEPEPKKRATQKESQVIHFWRADRARLKSLERT